MKEAIGGAFLFYIVVAFILLFTGLMCLTINRTKAFQVKDEIITIIEENEGLDLTKSLDQGSESDQLEEIVTLAKDLGYRTIGTCPSDKNDNYKAYDREGKLNSSNPSFCIQRTMVKDLSKLESEYEGSFLEDENKAGCFYSIVLFYKLDLPVLKEVFNFKIMGETKILYSENCKE